jgi:hypothetical protein
MTRAKLAVMTALVAAMAVGPASLGSAAEEAKLASFSTAGSLRDALLQIGQGRDVELVLDNGKSYRGKLGAIGNATVVLTQIAGKDFYDVLIVLDEIAAVEMRVRGN